MNTDKIPYGHWPLHTQQFR